jgi:hypothetical protein
MHFDNLYTMHVHNSYINNEENLNRISTSLPNINNGLEILYTRLFLSDAISNKESLIAC